MSFTFKGGLYLLSGFSVLGMYSQFSNMKANQFSKKGMGLEWPQTKLGSSHLFIPGVSYFWRVRLFNSGSLQLHLTFSIPTFL